MYGNDTVVAGPLTCCSTLNSMTAARVLLSRYALIAGNLRSSDGSEYKLDKLGIPATHVRGRLTQLITSFA